MTEFLFDGVNPVQETSGATVLANMLTGLGRDDFFTRTDVGAGATSSFLTDPLGSVLALADSAGTIQTEYTYEPFGRSTVTGASNTNPFQYTGRENDGTGLYYYRARYYQPGLQRFISEDPILSAGNPNVPFSVPGLLRNPLTLHAYAYVRNNPMNFVDPTGLIPECKCGAQPRFNREKFKTCLLLTHGIFPAAAIGCVVVIAGCVTGNVGACVLVPLVCGVEAIIIYGCYDAAFECSQ